MTISGMTKTRYRHAFSLAAALLLGGFLATAGKTVRAEQAKEEPMTTEEVVLELTVLTQKVTPFWVTYDHDAKWLIFREVLETTNKAAPVRIGELRVRLDRLDRTRVNYSVLEGGLIPIVLKGKPIAGRANFHCLEGEKCIARVLRGENEPAVFLDNSERTFGIDIFNDVFLGDLRRFTDLIGHLAVVAGSK
jgi:hypothetical protein